MQAYSFIEKLYAFYKGEEFLQYYWIARKDKKDNISFDLKTFHCDIMLLYSSYY